MARAPAGRWWTRPRTWEALAAAAFTTLVAWPFLSLTQYVTAFDTVTYSGPNTAFTFAELKAGHLPSWTPDLFGGTTHLGNPAANVLYPVKLPFVLLDPARAMPLITAAHLYVLAAGVFVLLAWRLRLRPPAAFVGTAAVLGSGMVMVRSIQFEQIAVIAWIPWVLVATDWAVSRRRLHGRAVALTAAAVGLLLVAGHLQQVYMALPVVAGWCVVRAVERAWEDDEPWTGLVHRLWPAVLGGVLGVGLAMAALVPIALQVPLSANSGARTLVTSSSPDFALAPRLTLAALLGSPLRENQAGSAGAAEAAAVVGVVTVVLALVGLGAGLTRNRGRVTAAFLGLVAVAGVVLAVGPQCTYQGQEQLGCDRGGVVYRKAFQLLPGFDQARVPARWLLVTVLALAVLAALGTDAVVRRRLHRGGALVAVGVGAGLVVVALVTGAALAPDQADDGGRALTGWIVVGLLAVAAVAVSAAAPAGRRRLAGGGVVALAVLLALELGTASLHGLPRSLLSDVPFTAMGGSIQRYLTDQPDRILSTANTPPDFAYLSQSLRPNANQTFSVRNLDGYDGGVQVSKPWVAAMTVFAGNQFNRDLPLSYQVVRPTSTKVLARFSVRYLVWDPVAIATVYGIPDPSSPTARAKAAAIVVPGWKGPIVTEGPLELWENPDWNGDAHVVRRTQVVPGAPDPARSGADGAGAPLDQWQATWSAALAAPSLDPDTALVTPGGPELRCDRDCASRAVATDRPRPGVVRATVDGDRDAMVVVPEQHLTGWTATVDGQPADIVSTDAMSQGVVVGPGRHTIELTYRPPGLGIGLVLSILSLMGVVALALLGRWNPPGVRRRGADEDDDLDDVPADVDDETAATVGQQG